MSNRTGQSRATLALSGLERRIAPAIFVVTSTSNASTAGSGSLRRAITDANNSAGPDTITFNIAGAGVQTIQINTTMSITEAVLIDGSSQPGFTSAPLIEVSAKGTNDQGFVVTNGGTTLRGLIVNGFRDDGILFKGGANNSVKGCWIGTDNTGLLDAGNGWGISVSDAATTTIGGTTAQERNVISGNDADNIRIWGPNADGTRVIGNYIGTDTTGLTIVGGVSGQGGLHGVWLGDTFPVADIGSPDHITIGGLNPGERNVIGGMTRAGVINFGDSHDNLIQGNYVGVSADGKSVLSNLFGITAESNSYQITIDRNVIVNQPVGGGGNIYSQGIILGGDSGTAHDNVVTGNLIGLTTDGTSKLGQHDHGIVVVRSNNNRIGSTTAAERNVIAGAAFDQVGFYGTAAFGNVVQGNFIGTDISGTKALGGNRGIWLGDQFPPAIGAAHDNTIGGTAAGAGNVIAGMAQMGVLVTLAAYSNAIQGNFIGTDPSGTVSLGNLWGIYLEYNSANNVIGGSSPGAGNVIAFNQRDGVLVGYDKSFGTTLAGAGNRISRNAIFSNGDLGIDLGSDNSVTPNDALDADSGSNQLQNFPVAVSAKSGATTLVSGVLKSAANSSYSLEFFAGKTADASGFGEGGRFLGSTTVTTGATGRVTFIDQSLGASTTAGEWITATATDAAGNTSEFSNATLVDVLPRIAKVTVNDGSIQRSRVTSVTVDFNQFVTLPANPAMAFQLRRQSDNALVSITATVTTDTFTSVNLTFAGGPLAGPSLADGRYILTVFAASAGNANGPLDGDANGTGGDNYVLVGNPATNKLFRLYGDGDGDGDCDLADFVQFRNALGTGTPTFDFDNDGDTDVADFVAFRAQFGTLI